MAAPVCIYSPCSSVDEQRLQLLASQHGLRLRKAAATAADLLVSARGSTLAFLHWPGPPAAAGRVERLAAAFKQAFVLVPHALLGDPAALEAAASCSCDESPTFVWMPMGADFAGHVLSLATALLAAEGEQAGWQEQQCEAAGSFEAVMQALQGLPRPPGADAEHHASLLHMLGSLRDISALSASYLVARAGIDGRTAAAVEAFLGERHGQPAGDRAPAPPRRPEMQSL